ncbi:hypothetical protein HYALB_00012266 [Hymenoscyphus albidus]|uniref:ASST-domain-containing protein n=1 Tax=Hymenoscyphus albidus TaxID=595503 RepID=A0A9N9LSV6_9HELO|nr:hypothetical protein HYALB_00012266 [Hymenoscyphus albidus]
MKPQIGSIFTAILVLARSCLADAQYKSRPDLSPPRLNITIPATSEVESGFIFTSPYGSSLLPTGKSGPEQPGAYIFTDTGDLVWSSLGYISGFVANFQAGQYEGQDVIYAFQGMIDLLHGHGFGRPVILSQKYELINYVTGGNHKVLDLHEFTIVDGKTALVEIYQQTVADLSAFGANETQNWIVDGVIQELDIATGKLIFEWTSLDHVYPKGDYFPLDSESGYTSRTAWDYIHINSVDKNAQGNYLISGRHTSTIYKISSKTGEISWKLGGKASTFTLGEGVPFGFQHDARFRSRSEDGQIEIISFFDNSARSSGHQEGGLDKVNDYSSGKIVQINHTDNTATLLHSVIHPDKVLAASQGNLQFLPNGNSFVNWGQSGSITEFGSEGVPVFNAYLDSGDLGYGVQSYRGFRYNWTGIPTETPAIISLKERNDINIYVSWNGDTETKIWRFYGINSETALRKKRRPFLVR